MSEGTDTHLPVDELTLLLGSTPLSWRSVTSRGYGRTSAHWSVSLEDGRTVFLKQALTGEAAGWLRKERYVYESVSGSFLPRYLGSLDDAGEMLLILEDLADAEWPPPWSPGRIDAVLAALRELHATSAPPALSSLEDDRPGIVGWPAVARDPGPLLATGLCSREWLEVALPALLEAGDQAELAGEELLHLDVRSDNLCLRAGRAVLFDWNLACRGSGRFDLAFWLPSLRLEAGPEPWEVMPGAGPIAAAVAGFFARRAGLPPPSGAPSVRQFQRAQAAVALPWAARELGLAPPF